MVQHLTKNVTSLSWKRGGQYSIGLSLLYNFYNNELGNPYDQIALIMNYVQTKLFWNEKSNLEQHLTQKVSVHYLGSFLKSQFIISATTVQRKISANALSSVTW